MTPEVPEAAIADAAERTAEELLWEAGVDGPPIDAFAVAERLGLVVASGWPGGVRGRLVRLSIDPVRPPLPSHEPPAWGQGRADAAILLAPEDRPERRQWAVAHELGEWATLRLYNRLGVAPEDTPPGAREAAANAIACRLLLPARWFTADGMREEWELPTLKRLYHNASHELIARRVLEQIDLPAVVAVVDQGRVAWRRSSFRHSPPPWASKEREAWRRCHETGDAQDSASAGEHILRTRAWPVHEPDWRREVVLTEYTAAG